MHKHTHTHIHTHTSIYMYTNTHTYIYITAKYIHVDFTLFEQCETHKQLKERETFWQHRLKTFYPLGLNEKEEYLH